MKDTIALNIEVPVASFRESRAKDYIASYPVPPPSSVDLLPSGYQGGKLQWLMKDRFGWLTLPYWVDHIGSAGTRWERYKIIESGLKDPGAENWTQIQTD